MALTNAEIARILYQLADFLELSDEQGGAFRVRALRTGAQAIDSLAQPAATLLAQGTLTKVKGIGTGIARRVEEIARSGKLAELEDLKKKVAPDLIELVRVEGVGPKTAQLVHAALGITTLDELEAAAREEKLRALPRLGAKREQQILQAIERARKHRGRVPLYLAEQDAVPLLERLKSVKGVARVEVAGSVRRRRDTVADVDLLAATRDPEAAMGVFVTAPSVEAILARGPTRSSVRLSSGLQVDLRVVPRASWGAALHYFTGSKDHNIAIRALGVRRGLKINEYGVFEVSGEAGEPTDEEATEKHEVRRVGGAEEEEVFAAVGLPFIPPELRENKGEIAAAREGRLPDLITLADLRGDLHTHTNETDGRATLEEMVNAAAEVGHEYMAITDHSQALKMVHGLDAERLRSQGQGIRAQNSRLAGKLRVLRGVEADILVDGSVDLGPDVLLDLDWVVGSVHSFFHLPLADQTRRIVRAMESGLIDALGHPTGRILGERPPYEVDMDVVVARAARTGVALELNAYPNRLDLSDLYCRMAREAGAWIVIDSDSHATTHLAGLKHGVDVARRAWLEARHVLNAQPLEFLLSRSARRRADRRRVTRR